MTKVDTVDRILSAAEDEITQRGIDGAKLENIARAAGVTKQLIYHYFKSKDHLYSTILETASRRSPLLADREVYRDLEPEDAIRHMVYTIFSGYIENPSYATLTLDQGLHDGEHIGESGSFIVSTRAFIAEVMVPVLERGAASCVFKPGLDGDTVFWMVFNLSAACFLNKKIMSETSPIDFDSDQGIAQWRETTAAFILDALR
ncbi:MAG: TetR/AcrR family transcriptional regulator [Porticoccaceae bacterium]|jgi:AcrR family transcriptional regulator|nr:TetR/AcrR family transcriptional regulator [Porticoccaceae bacterium]